MGNREAIISGEVEWAARKEKGQEVLIGNWAAKRMPWKGLGPSLPLLHTHGVHPVTLSL